MGFEDIRLAIESHMAAWGDAPIAWDGIPASPAVIAAQEAKEPWVRLTIQDGTSLIASVASSPEVRRTGIVFVQCFTAENRGSSPARTLADSIAGHLQFYRSGHLELLESSLQRVGPSDGYYQVNVSTPFRAGC